MASRRPLNILSSLDEAEEWHKQPYIHGLPKKFEPFGLDPPLLPQVTEQQSGVTNILLFVLLFCCYSWTRRHAALAQPFHFSYIWLHCHNAASW